MVKVNFIRDTETISVDMPVGRTIMEAAKELDFSDAAKRPNEVARFPFMFR